MRQEVISLYLRVLGYREGDGEWAAHCLETDLVGYGDSFQSALDNLKELTQMQVSFALYKNQPSLLDRPAPPEIFEIYYSSFRSCLQQFADCSGLDQRRRVTSIPWPGNMPDSNFAIAQM